MRYRIPEELVSPVKVTPVVLVLYLLQVAVVVQVVVVVLDFYYPQILHLRQIEILNLVPGVQQEVLVVMVMAPWAVLAGVVVGAQQVVLVDLIYR
jgi:hypothetical protein